MSHILVTRWTNLFGCQFITKKKKKKKKTEGISEKGK